VLIPILFEVHSLIFFDAKGESYQVSSVVRGKCWLISRAIAFAPEVRGRAMKSDGLKDGRRYSVPSSVCSENQALSAIIFKDAGSEREGSLRVGV
jgi:hypothetical protein